MESQARSSWIHLWVLVLVGGVWASPDYIINRTRLTFDEAVSACSPNVLATLTTAQELSEVLLISKPLLDQNSFTFWVGLTKPKDKCVVTELPLKGFSWLPDGSEEAPPIRWGEEPAETCVRRCAVLTGQVQRSNISLGLVSVHCQKKHPFICKRPAPRPGGGGATPEPKPARPEPKPARPEPKPATPEPLPATPEPQPARPEPLPATPEPQPARPEPKPATPEPQPARPEPKPATPEPKPATPEPLPATPEPQPATPEPGTERGAGTGPGVPGADRGPKSDPCRNPSHATIRSLTPDPVDSARVGLECWSGDRLQLHCGGVPVAWRLPDESPADVAAVCQPCDPGFHRNGTAHCVDVDECGGGHRCRHTCLNTVGSFRCVCEDADGALQEEGSEACRAVADAILIPVLVAVAALVLLVVVVAVTVKCCLMRRKRRAEMEMDSKTANEKPAA